MNNVIVYWEMMQKDGRRTIDLVDLGCQSGQEWELLEPDEKRERIEQVLNEDRPLMIVTNYYFGEECRRVVSMKNRK